MHAWYFGADGRAAQYAIDDGCGDLPCSRDENVTRAITASSAGDELSTAWAERCPLLDSVRQCHGRCQLKRRRRRIRRGINPDSSGHHVCQLETAAPPETGGRGAADRAADDVEAPDSGGDSGDGGGGAGGASGGDSGGGSSVSGVASGSSSGDGGRGADVVKSAVVTNVASMRAADLTRDFAHEDGAGLALHVHEATGGGRPRPRRRWRMRRKWNQKRKQQQQQRHSLQHGRPGRLVAESREKRMRRKS